MGTFAGRRTMGRKTKGLWKIKLALGLAGRKKLRLLDRKSRDCGRTQEELLLSITGWAKDTVYGREHGFDGIRSFKDYQDRVPINTYQSLEPYIARHRKGEPGVLFPGKPIMYATTSGTTKEPKWIPVTERYYKECYGGVSSLWFYSLLRECPHVFDGPELSIVGQPVEGYAEDGTVHGSLSGQMRKLVPKFLKEVHGLPDEVYAIPDYYARYYCIMRICIEQDIRLIITGNPSTLIELHNITQKHLDDFILDIERGGFKADLSITPEMRSALQAWRTIRPNPARAQELRDLKAAHEILYPKHYWPNIELINTWKCGNSGLYLKRAKGFFDEKTRIREFSYLASEVRAGIVLDSDDDSTILGGHLAVFEFIRKEDMGTDSPKVYLPHELEPGRQYYLLVTTQAGLYRYDMNDIIEVDGFYNQFPRFRFVQKGAGITSLTGEKLTEVQFMTAVQETAGELALSVPFYIGFANFDTSAYHFFVEFEQPPEASTIERFRTTLDRKLRAANKEYESKRGSNRIKEPYFYRLPRHAFDQFKADCTSRGFRDGQFKLTHLQIDDGRLEMFRKIAGRV
jgi:hypothetical protein